MTANTNSDRRDWEEMVRVVRLNQEGAAVTEAQGGRASRAEPASIPNATKKWSSHVCLELYY